MLPARGGGSSGGPDTLIGGGGDASAAPNDAASLLHNNNVPATNHGVEAWRWSCGGTCQYYQSEHKPPTGLGVTTNYIDFWQGTQKHNNVWGG